MESATGIADNSEQRLSQCSRHLVNRFPTETKIEVVFEKGLVLDIRARPREDSRQLWILSFRLVQARGTALASGTLPRHMRVYSASRKSVFCRIYLIQVAVFCAVLDMVGCKEASTIQ